MSQVEIPNKAIKVTRYTRRFLVWSSVRFVGLAWGTLLQALVSMSTVCKIKWLIMIFVEYKKCPVCVDSEVHLNTWDLMECPQCNLMLSMAVPATATVLKERGQR